MKFYDIEQGQIDWFRLRMGKVTASELGNLLTPEFAVRKGETPRTYLFEKLAEDWRGQPLIQTGSWATEQGQLREEEAVPWLELETGWKIRNGGFCVSDDGLMGCSPDGLVICNQIGGSASTEPPTRVGRARSKDQPQAGSSQVLVGDGPTKHEVANVVKVHESSSSPTSFGIEVKCPEPTAHVRYLMEGILPKAYICQVYGSMYVTGFKRWFFLSYQRGFPPLLIEIQRDEKIMQTIEEAVKRFRKDFDHAKARLRWIDAGGFDQSPSGSDERSTARSPGREASEADKPFASRRHDSLPEVNQHEVDYNRSQFGRIGQ